MSVAWFDGVTFTVEVALTTAPLAITPTWTDISAYVIDVPRIASGRSSEFSKFAPSSCQITLKNIDRRFDPEYSSGPYFGNLLPGKKIRVRVTYSAVTYDLFTGFVQGWPQSYIDAFDSNVTINAIDGSRILEQAVLPFSSYAQEVLADSPSHYWPLQEDSTEYNNSVAVPGLRVAENGMTQAASSSPVGASSMVQGVDTGSGLTTDTFLYASLTNLSLDVYGVEMWINFGSVGVYTPFLEVHTWDNADSYISFNIGTGNLLGISYSSVDLNRRASGNTSYVIVGAGAIHLFVRVTTTDIYLYVNGVQSWTSALSVGTFTAGSSDQRVEMRLGNLGTVNSVSHLAVYTTTLSAARIQAHYLAGFTAYGHPYGERSGARIGRVLDAIGWPAADRDLSTGDTVHGPYLPAGQSAMTYMRDVETAEDGLAFLDGRGYVTLRDRNWQWTRALSATFSDDGTDVDYAEITVDANTIDVIRNKVSATYGPNDAYLFSEDTTSRANYGPATEPLSLPTIDSANTARGLTQYKLRAMKDPQTRITELVTYPREVPATMFPVVLNLKLGDRINCEVRPQSLGSAIVETLTVQGIEHGWDADTWTTRLYLSPAPTSYTASPYLTLGDATYGKIGAVAGNKVPF